jgi:hypothetical protein
MWRSALLVVLSLGPARVAFADEPGGPRTCICDSVQDFGGKGVIAVTANLSGLVELSQDRFLGRTHDKWDLALYLSGDYFIADQLSIGAAVGFGNQDVTSIANYTIHSFILSASMGYNLWLSPALSWWPRVEPTVSREWTDGSSGPGIILESFSSTRVDAIATAPLLWHAAPHLFVGFGPRAVINLWDTRTDYTTVFRLQLGLSIGGWI